MTIPFHSFIGVVAEVGGPASPPKSMPCHSPMVLIQRHRRPAFLHDRDDPLIQTGTQEGIHRPLVAGIVKIEHQPIEINLFGCRQIYCRIAVPQQETVHDETAHELVDIVRLSNISSIGSGITFFSVIYRPLCYIQEDTTTAETRQDGMTP
ncbi:MAG: hypothetical protein JW781_05250 [Deltaproteobacteria bacterium]|nr:hypothetical protein [Candidatus Anaeroferrophillacea bacterium]